MVGNARGRQEPACGHLGASPDATGRRTNRSRSRAAAEASGVHSARGRASTAHLAGASARTSSCRRTCTPTCTDTRTATSSGREGCPAAGYSAGRTRRHPDLANDELRPVLRMGQGAGAQRLERCHPGLPEDCQWCGHCGCRAICPEVVGDLPRRRQGRGEQCRPGAAVVRPGPSLGCHLARLVAPGAIGTTHFGPCAGSWPGSMKMNGAVWRPLPRTPSSNASKA